MVPGSAPTRYTVFSDDGTSEAYLAGAGEKLRFSLDAKGFSVAGAAKKRDVIIVLPKSAVTLETLAPARVADDQRYWVVKVAVEAAERRYEF